ncbi:UNVERIFIED_CONTAM: hypothetical protein FKN15_052819 [Acipenser sinensis]
MILKKLDSQKELTQEDKDNMSDIILNWDLPPVSQENRRWLAEKILLHATILERIAWPSSSTSDNEDEIECSMDSNISSPMLLIALAVFLGAFYIIHLKTQESKLVLLGKTNLLCPVDKDFLQYALHFACVPGEPLSFANAAFRQICISIITKQT